MTAILKSDSVKVVLFLIALFVGAGVIVPLLIKAACYALLFVFDHPLIIAVAAISFVTGMLIGETK